MVNYSKEALDRLYDAISTLKTRDEVRLFMEDICTVTEMIDMAQRLETAQLLREGWKYNDIADKLKVSTATISRVSRCLKWGEGGYNIALNNLEAMKEDEAAEGEV